MSTPALMKAGPHVYAIDDKRGTWGMYGFIATEAMLFVVLFFSYFYLGRDEPSWPTGPDPAIKLMIPMTIILVASSFVLHHAEKLLKQERRVAARLWVLATILMGAAFIGLQVKEYMNHIKIELPTEDAYTSIFYTITSIHGVHVVLGMTMLSYVLMLPMWQLEPAERSPHRTLHNVSLYWHFVDVVWLFIVVILYLSPRMFN